MTIWLGLYLIGLGYFGRQAEFGILELNHVEAQRWARAVNIAIGIVSAFFWPIVLVAGIVVHLAKRVGA